MTPEEVASWLRVSPRTLSNWRSLGKGPPATRLGGRVAYRRGSVVAWASEQESEGPGQDLDPEAMRVKARHRKDRPGQIQVDVMFPHPTIAGSIYRKRLQAPAGLDLVGAEAWAAKQAPAIWQALVMEGKEPSAHEEAQEREAPTRKMIKMKSVPTLGELWIRWESEMPTSKEAQRQTQAKRWRKIKTLAQDIPCDAWTKTQSKQLLALFSGLGSGYMNHCCSLLRNLFRLAIEDDHLEDVPRLPRRKVSAKTPIIAHGQDDLANLLKAARDLAAEDGEPLELMILMGIDGGMRPGEVAGARWRDVDWALGQIIVQNQRPISGASDCAVKTGEAGRVSMTSRLRAALEEHRRSGGMSSPYLVTSKSGAPLYTTLVSERVFKVHAQAGLEPRRAHFMRHCSASRIFAEGDGNLGAAQAHLRHRLASTTQAYLHEVRGTAPGRAAAAILDRADATSVSPSDTMGQI